MAVLALDTALETALEEMSLDRLEAEITEQAGHLAAAECRWLLLIAEFDRRGGHEQWGCQTCAHWLSWQCGLAPRAARERVRVGRALEELPLITKEFALLEIALYGTATHVERSVRAYRKVLASEAETDVANTRQMARYLRYDWADDGSLVGHFRMTPEVGAIFVKALQVAREHVPTDPDGPAGPPCEPSATNSDALSLLAETFLAQLGCQRGTVVAAGTSDSTATATS